MHTEVEILSDSIKYIPSRLLAFHTRLIVKGMDKEVKKSVEMFFASYPLRHFKKGQIIIYANEAPPGIFYLIEGQVVEYDISSVGNEVVVNAFKPGAFFPMSFAINKVHNDYFFEAATPLTLRQAPTEDVIAFLKANPDVTFDLLRRVYLGTDGLIRRMAHLMGGKARSRLVFELLNAAARFGEKTPDGVSIPLTETDISKRSGMSRETISRTMRELKDAKLVIVQPGSMLIPDLKTLEDIIGNEL